MLTRIVLAVLLFMNLAYLGWSLAVGGAASDAIRHPAVPAPRTDVPRLQLLSETRPGEPEQKAAERPAAGPNRPPACFSLGPLRRRKEAERVLQRLQAAGLKADLRALEERAFAGYWVYLPPLPSRQEARKVARELAAKGIKDFYIVRDPDERNAISLGLFRDQYHANRRLAHLRSLGYRPRKRVRHRDRTVYWVDVQERPDARLGEALETEVLGMARGAGKVDRECPPGD